MYRLSVFILAISLGTGETLAGMPSPLPDHWDTALQISDDATLRLQAISFFGFGLLVSTVVVRWLWNVVAAAGWLPRLNWVQAMAMVLLWGAIFVTVLTMIAGARELMTPGAWRKDGHVYKLNPDNGR